MEPAPAAGVGGKFLIQRIVEIRDEEKKALLGSCLFFFFVLCAYYIVRPVREEMGVAGGVWNIPWLFTGTLIAMMVVHPPFAALVARLPRTRAVTWTYGFFSLNLVLFALILAFVPESATIWVGRVFYIWTAVFSLFNVSVFWSVMTDLFTTGQGKRLFGFIGVGGTLGGLVGSGITALLATTIGSVSLLLINGLNSDPAVYGEPTTLSLDRASGAEGERRIRAVAHLDHTTPLAVDSLTVTREGMGMGEVSLGSVGGNLDLGTGRVSLKLVRAGERLDATMQWNCPSVTWESTTDKSGVEEFVWRTISGLNSVVVDVEIAGTPSRFDLSVRSNVAGELARGLESQLGDQIRRTEARVRSEVDRRIESFVADARNRAEAVESEVEERLAEFQRQLDEVRAELQARIGNLTERLPAGIIPPA